MTMAPEEMAGKHEVKRVCKVMAYVPSGRPQACSRVHHATKNSAHLQT